ncbi:hypothetical protein NBRC116583_09390 [Arenicella sp. 4NH20-0111]|uniref:hypothetical protein n=1 Tax=Arenicella sp. 4NH20-0111 TaxID=3127648 RepID=UPI0031031757
MSDSNKKKSADIINPGLGDIEKVRDILFGKYVSSFENRFAQLEKRLEADVEALKDRLSNKIESMDEAVNQSLKRLDGQIDNEKANRDAELKSLQNALSDAETALQHAIASMEDQANQDLASVRLSLEESHQELLDQTLSVQAQMVGELEAQKQELEGDKVGRQALALMLDEVAVKLRTS